MGDAKRNDRTAKAIAFAKSRYCIFCGGVKLADTVDHYPPKGIFTEKKWPEGYVFPACFACNSGSRDRDNYIALISRMHNGAEPPSLATEAEVKKLVAHFMNNYPEKMRAMGRVSANEKRGFARRINWTPEPGMPAGQFPFIRLPSDFDSVVQEFATKLVKALHFEHARKIVPLGAGIKNWWFTNAQQLEGRVPQEIFSTLGNSAVLVRGQRDLSPQFNYTFAVSDCGTVGMYTAWFRFSFVIHSMLCFDAEVISGVESRATAHGELEN